MVPAKTRGEYLSRLREVCFAAAETGDAQPVHGKDAELLQMVRTLDGMDEADQPVLRAGGGVAPNPAAPGLLPQVPGEHRHMSS